MKKIPLLLIAVSGLYGRAHAQMASAFDAPVGAPPQVQLFDLNEYQRNHQFRVQLPSDGTLLIDFQRLSDWGAEHKLNEVAGIAADQVRLLKGELLHDYSTKSIDINIPVNGAPIAVRYREDDHEKNQRIYQDGTYYPLKTAFDTVVVVRNIGIRTRPQVDSGLVQIKYTFILKDISELEYLAGNSEILADAGNELDTAIARKRKKWYNQDARHHRLLLDYHPDRSKKVLVPSDGDLFPFMDKHIGVYVSFGGVIFRNSVSPFFDHSIGYILPSHNTIKPFVGLNITSFGVFNNDFSVNRFYNSINAEFGVFRAGSGLMKEKTSFALGMMYSDFKPADKMFHLGINYGVNHFFTIGLSMASELRAGKNNNGLMSVNFKINL